MSRSEFVEAYKDEKRTDIKDAIAEIQTCQHPIILGFWPAEVGNDVSCKVLAEREYLVLNSKELKKRLGVDRLTKAMTASIPCLRMPTEGDASVFEDTFWFAKTDQPYRLGKVTVSRAPTRGLEDELDSASMVRSAIQRAYSSDQSCIEINSQQSGSRGSPDNLGGTEGKTLKTLPL